MANMQVNTLPRNNELLWLQQVHNHRSYTVFTNPNVVDAPIPCRRCDGKLWNYIVNHNYGVIPDNIFGHIRNAGFAGVFEVGYHKLDHALITALVERWRPETHTFHLPVGEATITLEDVQVLYGLPIDAPPVSGIWHHRSKAEWIARCEELLGFQPDPRHIDGGAYRISSLIRHLDDPLEDIDIAYQQRARIYILALMGGMLFADTSQYTVPLNYIESIVDLSIESRLSWGSAVLADLYRNLCEAASNTNAKSIQGCLLLVQYWAWIRMPSIGPKVNYRYNDPYNFEHPYAARWNYDLSFSDTTAHVLVGYRSLFTALTAEQFIWRPYDDILHLLPAECREGAHLWGYQRYIIFWNIVELHLPGRVARQLGYVQNIPPNDLLLSPEEHKNIHEITRTGRRIVNWSIRLQDPYIVNWLNRANSIFQGQQMTPVFTTAPDYMQWYYDHTVLCITDPGRQGPANQYPEWGARQQLYQEGYRHMQQRAEEEMTRNPLHSQVFQQFAEFPTQIMQYGHQEERMNYSSQNFQFPDFNVYRPAPPSPPQNFHFGGGFSQFQGGGFSQFQGGSSSQFPGAGPSNTGYTFITPPQISPNMGTPSSQQSLLNTRGAFEPDFQMNPHYRDLNPIPMADYTPLSHSGMPDMNEMPPHVADLGADDDGDDGDDDDNDDDNEDDNEPEARLERPRRQIRRPPCGTHFNRR